MKNQRSGINDRKRSRIHGRYTGYLIIDKEVVPMTTNDLSLSGLLCQLENQREFALGLPCEVELPLSKDIRVTIKGTVARSTPNGTAVNFTSIDPDSYGHLHNIVRFMSSDPDSIDAEQTRPLFADQHFKPEL